VIKLVRDFKGFLLQGNLIALAVAFVIGTAFAALVSALVTGLVTPVIAAIFGKPDFSDLTFEINDSRFLYGHFLNALITFVSIAAAIFFFVLKPAQRVGLVPPPAEMKACPYCTSNIAAAATRCPQCTAELSAA
jgi:large conductance mechanosensitive channel